MTASEAVVPVDSKYFVCDVCNASCCNTGDLLDHMKSTHSVNEYECEYCYFKAQNETDI